MQIKHSIGYANPELLTDAFSLRQQVFTQEQGFPADIDVDEYDESALHVVLYLNDQPAAVLRCVLLERHSHQSWSCRSTKATPRQRAWT